MPQPAILVVDDDESIGDMLKLMLEHKGFTVIVNQDAVNLEEIIVNNSIDLVVLDLLIGQVKGTDVSVVLKSNAATAPVPLLMMTALPGMEETCIKAGANDFIAKPFEMDWLLSKVNKLIARD